MRCTHGWRRTVALAAVALAVPAGARTAAAQTAAADSVTAVITAFAGLAQARDVAGLDALVAPDAWVRIIEGAGVDRGWASYRDHHLVPELAEFTNFQYRFFDVEPQIRGDVAWAPFQYELVADTPRGHAEVDGRGTAVMERRDGRWIIVHLHTSGRRRASG